VGGVVPGAVKSTMQWQKQLKTSQGGGRDKEKVKTRSGGGVRRGRARGGSNPVQTFFGGVEGRGGGP